MKKSISKKLFSLFLAVVMLATSLPFASFTASAAQPLKSGAKYKYVFAYFTATSTEGQKVNIAVSDDGLNYTRMAYFNGNGQSGVMKQSNTLAKRSNAPSARDPFIFDGKDGYYYIIATDADCSISDNPYWDNSRSFVLWRSKDMLNWSEEKLINMESVTGETVYRAWAPQVYVLNDAEMEARGDNNHEYPFMVYFAMASSTSNRTDMYCSFAKDLYNQDTWTKPQLQYRPCDNVNPGAIDGDIVKIGDEYIMYVKDEDIANDKSGTLQTYWVSASTPWGPYENQKYSADRLITNFVCEGANSFYIGSDLYMIVDSNKSQNASSENMKLLKATDATGKHFTDVTSTTNIPSLNPKHGSILAVPVADSTLVPTANEYEVTGNVTIDNPIIYTHGKYAGLAYHPYAYMMNGAYISNGWFDGEYTAPTYTVKAGVTITDVYAEGTNAVIGYSDGKLTGYLGDGFNSSSVTLVFKFANGTYERHTLAVKTNPVAQHAVAGTHVIQNGTWKSVAAFEVLAKGSTGSTTGGSYSSAHTKYDGYRNFPAMYKPYDDYYTFQMSNSGTNANVYIGGLRGDTITVDKTVGYYACSGMYTVVKNSGSITLNSPTATYYIDKSAPTNSGATKNANGSYSIEFLVGNLKVSDTGKETKDRAATNTTSKLSANPNSLTLNSSNIPASFKPQENKLGSVSITTPANPTSNLSGTYQCTYLSDNGSCDSTTTINLPFSIIISDKSSLRSLYNTYRAEYKIEKCYTADSWSKYVTALRDAESYLGDATNTNTDQMNAKKSALETAHTNLVKTTDIAAHQNPAALSDCVLDHTTNATCNSKGYDTYKCNLCGQTFDINETEVAPHTYKYATDTFDKATFNCEWIETNHCGKGFDNNIDFQVYSALDMVYKTIDHTKYTASGNNALETAYNSFVALKNMEFTGDSDDAVRKDIEDAIDSAQRELLNAINTVNLPETVNGFNVTFKVMVDGDITHEEVIPGKYGDFVSLDASAYTNGLTCTTWTVNVDKSDYANGYVKNIANASNEYNVLVQSDTTVIAKASSQDSAKGVPVIIKNQYGNPLYTLVAPADESVTFESANKIVIGGMPYEVPNMPFYTIKSWNGQTLTANMTTTVGELKKNADGTVVLYPDYDEPEKEYEIKMGADIVAYRAYDEICTVTASGAYGIAIQNPDNSYSIVSYTTSYSFYANRNMQFYPVTRVVINGQTIYQINDWALSTANKDDRLIIHNLDNKLPFVYSAPSNAGDNKFTTFSAYSKNGGTADNKLKIVEVGTLYTKNTNVNADNFVFGANGVKVAVSKNEIDFSNQYSISIKNGVGQGISTRAYVKYSYVYGGETIEAIAYGNICTL